MHGHGIANALRSTVSRLAAAGGGVGAAVGGILVAVAFAALATMAFAGVEYDYVGSSFLQFSRYPNVLPRQFGQHRRRPK